MQLNSENQPMHRIVATLALILLPTTRTQR